MSDRGTLAIPEATHRIPPTDQAELDRAVEALRAGAKAWVDTDVATRIQIIDELIRDTHAVAEQWVRVECEIKRIPADGPLAGEEWVGGPVLTLRNLRLLRNSLADIERYGLPRWPGPVSTRPDGQVTVGVLPAEPYDRVLLRGFRAEVWMQPEVTTASLPDTVAVAYRGGPTEPQVCLVLGAGNVSAIPATDTLYQLFVRNQVVILKMNPVNEQLGPVLAEAFRALIDRGALRIVYGGAEQGSYLAHHEGVDTIHLTGSDKTHDAIVFGTGEEGARRKAANDPLLRKPVTSELGNVTPIIVVPGPWSRADIAYHAVNIATMIANNAGFNCIAGRLIITHRRWARRRELIDAVCEVLRQTPQRYPYYPGAVERWRTFVEAHPNALRFGVEGEDRVPWTFLPELDPDSDDIAFTTEVFCGVIGEVPMAAPTSVEAFLDRAVEFCNTRVWGNLAASLIVHPRSLRDPQIAAAVDRALAGLRYGSIVVNNWAGAAYGLVSPPWGAFPGNPLNDISSGRGFVHNTYMFDQPQKTVVHTPFRITPTPPWFVTHRRSHEVMRRWADLEARPSPARLPGLFAAALRG